MLMTSKVDTNIFDFFENSLKKYGENYALHVDGEAYTYNALHNHLLKFARGIYQCESISPFVGILAHRSITAFAAVLSILRSGRGYIPINPKFPEHRNQAILQASELDVLVLGKEAVDSAVAVLKDHNKPLELLVDFDAADLPDEIKNQPNIKIIQVEDSNGVEPKQKPSEYAYLLFTSGSTGLPKGVPISHQNVASYVNYLLEEYKITSTNRFSQTFDLTFDLSVHDMFLAWGSGSTLYCIPEKNLMGPGKYIRDHQLTHWFSVPSLGIMMNKFKMLKEGAFDSLKMSMFCGEPFPTSLAKAWAKAAPNSQLVNIYGPTEATIGITHYNCPKDIDRLKSKNGIVSLGTIFKTQSCLILDEQNQEVKTGDIGELCLGGSQVTTHYWNNKENTQKSFVKLPNSDRLWYKTGDLVSTDNQGNIYYSSRKDFQVKIRGYRVESEEINHLIQEFTGVEEVVAIPFPIMDGVADGIHVFVHSSCTKKSVEVINHCKEELAPYMVPKEIIFIDSFPLNSNGKIDRKALMQKLEEVPSA